MSKRTRVFNRAYEEPDPTPITTPVGFTAPEPLHIRIRRMVRSEQLRAFAISQGVETFEEADDFDIPDDPIDPSTPFELTFDPDLGKEITQEQKRFLDEERDLASKEINEHLKKKRRVKKEDSKEIDSEV